MSAILATPAMQPSGSGKSPASPAEAHAPSRGRGIAGSLRLVCGVDSRGQSALVSQSFCAPIHISKPHLDSGTLVVNVVNPTAGLLAGDRLTCSVRVEAGASLLLTAPSASRAHAMRGGCATVRQHFSVASGGCLDWWPDLFIPQKQSSYRQTTAIDVEPGGNLLYWEMLAPGRVASGEAFEFDSLEWSTDVRSGGVLVARERYRLTRSGASVAALRRQFPTGYYASCLAHSPKLSPDSPCWAEIHGLHTAECWIGFSSLFGSGWSVKLVAANSIALRRGANAVRQALYASLGKPQPSLRRAAPVL